jgi:hypothetical protein
MLLMVLDPASLVDEVLGSNIPLQDCMSARLAALNDGLYGVTPQLFGAGFLCAAFF